MANLASAKKRNRQNEVRHERNRARKSELKTETRKMMDAIHEGDLQTAQSKFLLITKKLDQVSSKGTFHRNTASRKKSRLAKHLNTALAAKSKK